MKGDGTVDVTVPRALGPRAREDSSQPATTRDPPGIAGRAWQRPACRRALRSASRATRLTARIARAPVARAVTSARAHAFASLLACPRCSPRASTPRPDETTSATGAAGRRRRQPRSGRPQLQRRAARARACTGHVRPTGRRSGGTIEISQAAAAEGLVPSADVSRRAGQSSVDVDRRDAVARRPRRRATRASDRSSTIPGPVLNALSRDSRSCRTSRCPRAAGCSITTATRATSTTTRSTSPDFAIWRNATVCAPPAARRARASCSTPTSRSTAKACSRPAARSTIVYAQSRLDGCRNDAGRQPALGHHRARPVPAGRPAARAPAYATARRRLRAERRAPASRVVRERRASPAATSGTRTTATTTCSTRATPPQWIGNGDDADHARHQRRHLRRRRRSRSRASRSTRGRASARRSRTCASRSISRA